jgi:hypothetical protein
MSEKENQVGKYKSAYRKPGALKGQIKIPDDFDEPMSEEELSLWYDGPIFPGNEIHSKKTGE